jgi:Ca2+:H+ antiporter
LPWAIGALLGATALIALVSHVFVESVQHAAEGLGMSQAFVGFVVVALVGGAAESFAAISAARRNRLDMSVGIAIGSAAQIALFVAPVLVLLSGFIAPGPLELSFSRAEIGTLFLGVLIAAIVAGDGRSNWYKGVQLTLVYAMIAILFYFLPAGAH